MAGAGPYLPILSDHSPCGQFLHRFFDRGTRNLWGIRAGIIFLHVIFVSVLFLLDGFMIKKTRDDPWYTTIYLGLFVATLVQYLLTSVSSPGYVLDAMRAGNGTDASILNVSSNIKNKSAHSTMDNNQLRKHIYQMNSSSWLKRVMELYPPGSSSRNWTCSYCDIIQPPRTKHCHECDKCVLKFDHHCAWLGTCIGQGNHCRFLWYVFEETILCIWTCLLYIIFLRLDNKAWWKDSIVIVQLAIVIILLVFLLSLLLFHCYLILTNQTTYEFMRRQRIFYLREIPAGVHPFSKGIFINMSTFCCSTDNVHAIEALPTMEEIEARARPYSFVDIISCRCF